MRNLATCEGEKKTRERIDSTCPELQECNLIGQVCLTFTERDNDLELTCKICPLQNGAGSVKDQRNG